LTTWLDGPRVHGDWTRAWWNAEAGFTSLFGDAPSEASFLRHADSIAAPERWTEILEPGSLAAPPQDALVVLAGQQVSLGAGALLVAHKAITAVALARALEGLLERVVVPVFLLATEDHDSSEVDHLDFVHPAHRRLTRVRCPLRPGHDSFSRSHWSQPQYESVVGELARLWPDLGRRVPGLSGDRSAAAHARALLLDAFEPLGLRLAAAHRASRESTWVFEEALRRTDELNDLLVAGGVRLERLGLRVSFDGTDRRPLVFESRDGRRRRIGASDHGVLARLGDDPGSFSPHAALRPLVQANSLPVVAQICGPSELLYLGQARALHTVLSLPPPILVPRLEATRVPSRQFLRPDVFERSTDAIGTALLALLHEAGDFTSVVRSEAPSLDRQLRRFLEKLRRDAQRLAEAPHWRTARLDEWTTLLPRGRAQDTVLAWIADAYSGILSPPDWANRLLDLCRPMEPPRHVLHDPFETR